MNALMESSRCASLSPDPDKAQAEMSQGSQKGHIRRTPVTCSSCSPGNFTALLCLYGALLTIFMESRIGNKKDGAGRAGR